MSRESNRPVGDAMAVIERDRNKTDFVPLGPIWMSEKGNLTFTMMAEPLEWRRDLAVRRMVLIRLREGFQVVNQAAQIQSQSYAPAGASNGPARGGEDEIPFDASSADAVVVDVDVP